MPRLDFGVPVGEKGVTLPAFSRDRFVRSSRDSGQASTGRPQGAWGLDGVCLWRGLREAAGVRECPPLTDP